MTMSGKVPGGGAGSAGPAAGESPGYMSSEIVGCQFSMYPLRQEDLGPAVRAAIEAVHAAGCSLRVGNLSTLLTGSEDQVFSALRVAFRAAQEHGPAVMTATLAAGMPTDELVAQIQNDVAASAGTPAQGPGATTMPRHRAAV